MPPLGAYKRGLIGLYQTTFERVPSPTSRGTEIGLSEEGRPIHCYRFGNGKEKVLFVAAIHGNEVGTHMLALNLIAWLEKNENLFPGLEIHIIPCLNPDGNSQAKEHPDFLQEGKTGRFNAHNVDLNRNFRTHNFQPHALRGHGKNYQETEEVYAGESPFSEAETRALETYMKQQKFKTYIAFHSAGHDVMPNNHPRAHTLAKLFSAATGFRFLKSDNEYDAQYTGTAKQYCDEQSIAYIEIEASTRWGSDWKNQFPGLHACLEHLNHSTQ